MKQPRETRKSRGFARTSTVLQPSIRKASEGRGFAVTRLLTHWAEVVGEGTAKIATPVGVSYAKSGMGATLTVLTTGAQAPMLEMEKEKIRNKVNACYGYNAIARIKVTQTAPTGFAEGRVAFVSAPEEKKRPDAAMKSAASDLSKGIKDDGLRGALAALGANVLSKQQP